MPGVAIQTSAVTRGQTLDSIIGNDFRMLVQNLQDSHNSTLTQLDSKMDTIESEIRAAGFGLHDSSVTDPAYLYWKAQYLIVSTIRSTRFPASVEAEVQSREKTSDILSGNGYADWLKIVDMAWRGHMGSLGLSAADPPASADPLVQEWTRRMFEITEQYVGYAPAAEGLMTIDTAFFDL